jgi:putative oxidoreductase
MKRFFSTEPVWYNEGLFVVRLVLGIFMVYHGWEVFDKVEMDKYATWDQFKNTGSPVFMVYLGKIAELVGGVLLILGWLTRLGAIMVVVTMAYISFFVGKGIIWYGDQHPFMFVLLGLVFIFTGPGCYSLDAAFELKRNKA